VTGLGPARHWSFSVPVTTGSMPPTADVGLNTSDSGPIGLSASGWLAVAPSSDALTVPDWMDATAEVAILKLLYLEPAGIVTVAGIVAATSVSLIVTVCSLAAGAGNSTVPTTLLQPMTSDTPSLKRRPLKRAST